MNKKTLIIIIVIILFLTVLAFSFGNFFGAGSDKGDSSGGTSDTLTQGSVPDPETVANVKDDTSVSFQTVLGEVKMNNFFLYPVSSHNGEEVIVLAKNNDYFVYYSFDGNFFALELINSDLPATARVNAEFDLLNVLGVDEVDACKLPIDVLLVNQYTSRVDGTNYGLSFCSGSLLLFDN